MRVSLCSLASPPSLLVLALIGGCASTDTPAETAAAVSDADVTGSVAEASCATTDHPLRFRCTLTTEAEADVVWQVREGEAVIATFTTHGTDHEQLLWGLPEATELTWSAATADGGASGSLTTGTADVGSLSITTAGSGLAADHVLVPLQCSDQTGLVMFDEAGRVTWYEPLGGGSVGGKGGLQGFDRTPDGFVAGVDGDTVVEVGPDGTVLRELTGFTNPLHHDLAADDDGRLYLLEAFEEDGYVLDAVRVFDGAEEVGLFTLADVVTPSGGAGDDRYWDQEFPGAVDWSHTNSVELVGDGTAVLSMKAQNALMAVVVDPDAADFGEVAWTLTGDDSQLASDFAWSDGGGFYGQHHASIDREGRLMVFDNRDGQSSRGVVIDLDADAGEAREVATATLDSYCPTQGATYELEDGGLLLTCANEGSVHAFAPSGEEVWSATVSCGTEAPLARAMPL